MPGRVRRTGSGRRGGKMCIRDSSGGEGGRGQMSPYIRPVPAGKDVQSDLYRRRFAERRRHKDVPVPGYQRRLVHWDPPGVSGRACVPFPDLGGLRHGHAGGGL